MDSFLFLAGCNPCLLGGLIGELILVSSLGDSGTGVADLFLLFKLSLLTPGDRLWSSKYVALFLMLNRFNQPLLINFAATVMYVTSGFDMSSITTLDLSSTTLFSGR